MVPAADTSMPGGNLKASTPTVKPNVKEINFTTVFPFKRKTSRITKLIFNILQRSDQYYRKKSAFTHFLTPPPDWPKQPASFASRS